MSYAMFISAHARNNKFHTCIRIWNDPMTKKLVESIYNHFNNQSINSIVYWPICNQGRLAYEKTEQCQGASSSRNLEQEDGCPRGGRGGAKEEDHSRLPQVMENVVVAGS